MSKMHPMQIVEFADKCAIVFHEHLSANTSRGAQVSEGERQVLETQNARFKLWADTIGGFGDN